MKRSVNFNGMKRWKGATADDLLATFRMLGMTDEEIKAKLLEIKAEREAQKPAPLMSDAAAAKVHTIEGANH